MIHATPTRWTPCPGRQLLAAARMSTCYPAILRPRFDAQEQWLRVVTQKLRTIPASAARVELVLRRALVDEIAGYGVTWFVEGCGATADRADQGWSRAFDAALAAIMDVDLA